MPATGRTRPARGGSAGSYVATVAGGQISDGALFAIVPGSPSLALAGHAGTFWPFQPDLLTSEATGLYRVILGRDPDAPGLAAAVSFLQGGGSISALSWAFLRSNEYLSNLVADDYHDILGRAASPTEVAAWVAIIQQRGLSAQQVTAGFLGSTEFNADHASDTSFLQALYTDILGRTGAAPEVAAWMGFMGAGMSRAEVVELSLDSTEADRRAVNGLYEFVLGRFADEPGLDVQVALLGGSMTMDQLDIAFFGSSEYLARANSMVST